MSESVGTVVTFDYPTWSSVYPEFANTVTQTQAQFLFTNKTPPYIDNTGYGAITDVPTLTGLMYDLVAHLAQIQYGSSIQQNGPLVGRIASAGEGSVSASVSMDGVPGSAAWFMQTKYGANFWAATASYRSAMWIGPARVAVGGDYDNNIYAALSGGFIN